MRTVILFSSFFYLLGLKLGQTVELIKRVAVPVRTVIQAPPLLEDKPDRAYFFHQGGSNQKKPETEKKAVNDSIRNSGASASKENQGQSR
jgi:hypothetical protein